MRITVKRLRLLVLSVAFLLLAVLAGFFFYARYRIRHIAKDLPGKLGIDIERTADGYTVSRSEKGHTTFTIHASKLVTLKSNGHAVLHDVAITLYGPPGSNRKDHVYGSDFDYDQKNGVASALGEVQIDIAPPNVADGAASGQKEIHIKASNLVFDQKSGIARTDQHVEFFLPKASGQGQGAAFNAKTGELVLDQQVELTSNMNDQAVVVHASHAEFERETQQAVLQNAACDFRGQHSTAQHAVIYFRKDGSAERLEAQGNVRTVTNDGAEVLSQTLNAALDEKSQPVQAILGGGVRFVSRDAVQSMQGSAAEGTLTFANAALKHAQFRNAVNFTDQQVALPNDAGGSSTRQLQAARLDVDFVPGAKNKSIAQRALATGNAVATLHSTPTKGPQQNTVINGDQLLATLADGRTIQRLDGTGHTKITDLARDGALNVSTGDSLHVTFTPAGQPVASQSAQKKSIPQAQSAAIDSAVQEGNVTLTQTPAKNAKPVNGVVPQPLHAYAGRAEYREVDQILHLTGNPRIENGMVELSAQQIDYNRNDGDAYAKGNVKGTYLHGESHAGQPSLFGGQGPVHLIASEAELHHASDNSIFRGQARMWQNADSVSAPVIELSRTKQTLYAHGDDAPVHTTIASLMGSKKQPTVVRVQSGELHYDGNLRRGDFDGNVTATNPDGVVRSDHAQFYLLPETKSSQPAKPNTPQNSQIDRIVATGRVVLTQPGRKGAGEKLVYTAQDGRYVLTGTASAPPRIEDATRGATTGAALIFNDQDDSVEVSGGRSAAVTTTRAPK